MSGTMKQVVLASYAQGNPKPSDFRVEDAPIPQPGEGEVLLRTLWLGLDPLIRFAIDEKRLSGVTQVHPGEVMYGPTVSEVVASNHPGYAVGDVVEDRTGWREYAIVAPDKADWRGPPRKLDPAQAPVSTALGALGMPGQTAHACVIGIGRVAAGETVVISAAAGAVGSLAGQIAKIRGARVIGIAGGPDKCRGLIDLGFDAAADYKAPDFAQQLAKTLPEGADVFIDNVGGEVMLAVLPHLKRGARMPVCGFIAYYGMGLEGPGPDRLPGFFRTIMAKGLEIKGFGGFLVGGQQALDDIAGWIAEGRIHCPESVVEGLEAAPEAFAGVFSGNNHLGKLLVKVSG
ncbi:NADP-dependent oxidoreductase [Novosphingobium sp. TCA1]|uniref:NADP-dependent oxidoreductase n=1 Tax=Novosphingobium sp. TCA1 TaxID=2682474 RepID=UPI00130D2AF4|nr:NADP-dependent oxidoreductase [Novosphingobium sp. TCA1]GFE76339.1 NADP-dependent oxidoreductase [Novosphingobium sp. TCA1]